MSDALQTSSPLACKQPLELEIIIISILWMRKLIFKERKFTCQMSCRYGETELRLRFFWDSWAGTLSVMALLFREKMKCYNKSNR